MTKSELYNAFIDLYYKSGQGAPYEIFNSDKQKLMDELVAEGLLKKVEDRSSYFPLLHYDTLKKMRLRLALLEISQKVTPVK